jgi:diguanylate cyclase (GGDEF)-like protein
MDTHSQIPAAPASPSSGLMGVLLRSRRHTALGLALSAVSGAALGAMVGALAMTAMLDLSRAAAASLGSSLGLAAGIGAAAGAVVALMGWMLATALAQARAQSAPPASAATGLSAVEAARASSKASARGDSLPETQPMPLPMSLPDAVPTSFDQPSDIRDALTGAYTQRYFIAAADREWSRIRRHGEDAALLMIDADNLQKINQSHGQACGDAVLVQLTRLVNATLRQYDLMARFNAGVLVVYLPQTDPIGAIDVAERIRERIHNFRMSWPTGSVAVTVSVGVASIGADHTQLDAVIGDAGAALRAAKDAGRNCVRAAPVPPKRSAATMGGDRRAPGSH